jgi:hypothetical protein
VVARLLAKVPQLMPAVGSTWRPTTSNAERQGRCPLQLAGYEVGAIPLFHLINRPNPSRLRQAIAAGYDLAA